MSALGKEIAEAVLGDWHGTSDMFQLSDRSTAIAAADAAIAPLVEALRASRCAADRWGRMEAASKIDAILDRATGAA